MDPEMLASWLLENGYAEEERGYGHVCADDLAEALVSEFVLRRRMPDSAMPFRHKWDPEMEEREGNRL